MYNVQWMNDKGTEVKEGNESNLSIGSLSASNPSNKPFTRESTVTHDNKTSPCYLAHPLPFES
jgi:hypothetical protein